MVERSGLGVPQLGLEEGQVLLRGGAIRLLAQDRARPRHRAEHQAVPGRQHLVVALRAHALRARGGHLALGRGQQGLLRPGQGGVGDAQHVLVRQRLGMAVVNEVALLGDAEVADRHFELLGREQLRQLRARPAVELALVPFAVGVFRGVEAAVRVGHVPQHVIEDVARDLGVAGLAADQVGIEIQLRQLRVVVEHLLEMRHQPFGIHRVAGEAAAQVIVNAARGHAVAGVQHHAHGLLVVEAPGVAQQKLRLAGLGKLGRAAEPAVLRVVALLEERARVAHDRGGQHQPGQAVAADAQLLEARMDVGRRVGQLGAARLPELLDLLQDLQKARPPVAAVRREIGPAEERLEVRREKHVQRPAALPARGLDERHVDLVHVRPLLAVHLDADEVRVEERGDLGALEGLALHDVAPMAGRVADAQEDGPVLLARPGEGLLAPRIPVHRVVLVLEQVGRFLPRQPVRVGRRSGGGFSVTTACILGLADSLAAGGQTHGASQRQGSHRASIHSGNHSPQWR